MRVEGILRQAQNPDPRERICAVRELSRYLPPGDDGAVSELRRILTEAMAERREPVAVAAALAQLTQPHVPIPAAVVAAAAAQTLSEGKAANEIAASLRRCAWPAGRIGGFAVAALRLLSVMADDEYLLRSLGG